MKSEILRDFAIRLDNIIIGRQKIFVNLPRFQEERGNEVRNNAPRPLHKSQYVQRQKTGPTNGGISYAQALGNTGDPSLKGKKKGVSPGQFEFAHLEFKVDEGVVQKLNNAYVGKVSKSGTTYCTQEELTRRGILEIKATPMGANLVLMEETVEGALSDLLSEVWVSEWFEEIRSWSAREIDNERVVWLRCYGVPAHAWSVDFFSFLVTGMGDFICVDENTLQKKSMDVARILYKTRVHDLVSKLIKVDIGGDVFSIKMIEEWYGPMQWSMSKKLDDEMSSGSNSEEEEEDEEWHKSREDNEGTFSVEDSLSDQSINEQPLQNTVSETRDIEGSVNNLEDEMIQDILQRNVAGSINGGLDNFSASIDWVADNSSVQGSQHSTTQVDGSLSNQIGLASPDGVATNVEDAGGPFGSLLDGAQNANSSDLALIACGPQSNGNFNFPQDLEVGGRMGCFDQRFFNSLGQRGIEVNLFQNPGNNLTIVPFSAMAVQSEMVTSRSGKPNEDPLGHSHNPSNQGEKEFTARSEVPCVRLKSKNKRGRPRKHVAKNGEAVDATDSDIMRCNDVFWNSYEIEEAKKKDATVATKIASIANDIGVTGFGDQAYFVDAIHGLEERDLKANANRGGQNKPK